MSAIKKNRLKGARQLLLVAALSLFSALPVMATDEYTVELYETYCKACHGSAGAGVPVAFNEGDWEKKLHRGLDSLVKSAVIGVGNMPAQGSCMECSYEDFEDLINYMSKSKAN